MTTTLPPITTTLHSPTLDLPSIKARQKATWESGDFGEIAKSIEPAAEDFMSRLPLRRGDMLLDAACGTGNLAVIAARAGCVVQGVDIATNLIAQARQRARAEKLDITYTEGDAEALPYPDASFDVVVSMYGVMFTPQPERIAQELRRVTKPGGLIAMANWTPTGFIGKMFDVFRRHVPPPAGLPSPLQWGDEKIVSERLLGGFDELRLTRRIARMRYPLDPAGTVEFFRQYYGPTHRAFASLTPGAQADLRADLERLQAGHNVSGNPDETEVHAEYLEIHACRTAAI
jgi:SAM-dependent methyltransferase